MYWLKWWKLVNNSWILFYCHANKQLWWIQKINANACFVTKSVYTKFFLPGNSVVSLSSFSFKLWEVPSLWMHSIKFCISLNPYAVGDKVGQLSCWWWLLNQKHTSTTILLSPDNRLTLFLNGVSFLEKFRALRLSRLLKWSWI